LRTQCREYEISNHLGNVLATVSDVKLPEARVLSHTDYYAFGSAMPGRSGGASYRYGFGGHERDDEIKGAGNHLSFGDFGYDPRIGRRWNVDPKFHEIAGLSPYAYSLNNPLVYIDRDGKLPILPLLLKAGAAGASDMLIQAAVAYLFDPEVQSASQAFEKVNWWQVGRSALEGALPLKAPGGRLGKAAASAAGDVMINALSKGGAYTTNEALQDFAAGFVGALTGEGLGELVSKYGSKAVARGLSKLGFDDEKIEKLLTGAGTTWKGPVDYGDLDLTDAQAKTRGINKKFTSKQKEKILEENKKANNGRLRSDQDGQFLDKPEQDKSGVPTNMNSAQVDHVVPRKGKTVQGSNTYSNAQVLSKKQNMDKSNQ
jgi:RHS repeat-associated protein